MLISSHICIMVYILGVCRIVILPDSRISGEFQLPDTGYPVGYPVLPDTGYPVGYPAIKGIYWLISYLSY